MLFSMNKTMIAVLVISCFLSVQKAQAIRIPYPDLRTTGAVLAAGYVWYESTRTIKPTTEGSTLSSHDKGTKRWQSLLETARSPKVLTGTAVALALYSVGRYGTNSPIVQFVSSLVNPKK